MRARRAANPGAEREPDRLRKARERQGEREDFLAAAIQAWSDHLEACLRCGLATGQEGLDESTAWLRGRQAGRLAERVNDQLCRRGCDLLSLALDAAYTLADSRAPAPKSDPLSASDPWAAKRPRGDDPDEAELEADFESGRWDYQPGPRAGYTAEEEAWLRFYDRHQHGRWQFISLGKRHHRALEVCVIVHELPLDARRVAKALRRLGMRDGRVDLGRLYRYLRMERGRFIRAGTILAEQGICRLEDGAAWIE